MFCIGGAIFSSASQALAVSPPAKSNTELFDWSVNQDPAPTQFAPSPVLTNTNAAQIATYLTNHPGTKALKVVDFLTSAASKNIFNQFKVEYVFQDLEDNSNANFDAYQNLQMIRASTQSNNAFIGQFNVYPGRNVDPTLRVGNPPTAKSFKHPPHDHNQFNYNMANEPLYPGEPDMRNPASGDSNAPNIRSALFNLPIERLTTVQQNLPAGAINIPWTARFNNSGNSALSNQPGNAQYPNQFNTTNQLLSRGDFSALVLHYRMRGANSVNLFEPGVIGYTKAQEQQDATSGWDYFYVENWLKNSIYPVTVAKLDNDVRIDGKATNDTIEKAGVVWSAMTSKVHLRILLSNLDEKNHSVEFAQQLGVANLTRSEPMPAGTHRFLMFSLNTHTGQWVLDSDTQVFFDPARNGVGVPEPTMLGLFGFTGLVYMSRRRRRTA
jgi:hypothetical protein